MTVQELNRDIKRLVFNINKKKGTPEYYNYIQTGVKKEFTRLYHADSSFTSLTKNSLLIMLRLNVRYRFIEFHQFGLMINVNGID